MQLSGISTNSPEVGRYLRLNCNGFGKGGLGYLLNLPNELPELQQRAFSFDASRKQQDLLDDSSSTSSTVLDDFQRLLTPLDVEMTLHLYKLH